MLNALHVVMTKVMCIWVCSIQRIIIWSCSMQFSTNNRKVFSKKPLYTFTLLKMLPKSSFSMSEFMYNQQMLYLYLVLIWGWSLSCVRVFTIALLSPHALGILIFLIQLGLMKLWSVGSRDHNRGLNGLRLNFNLFSSCFASIPLLSPTSYAGYQ